MTRRRWIADRVEGDRAWLLGQNAVHLVRVLRAYAGQQFDVAANGVLRLGTIVSATLEQVEFQLGEPIAGAVLPEVDIYLSIFKFDRMEWALEKLTELGVNRVVPVIAARTALHLAKPSETRLERWRKIVREAAQQSRRTAPPEIPPPVVFKKAFVELPDARIVLSELEGSLFLKAALAQSKPPLALAFGPEGGWTDEELELFQAGGWKSASLGGTILRAETAAIAALAVAMAELIG